jgi:hypothetical protein
MWILVMFVWNLVFLRTDAQNSKIPDGTNTVSKKIIQEVFNTKSCSPQIQQGKLLNPNYLRVVECNLLRILKTKFTVILTNFTE